MSNIKLMHDKNIFSWNVKSYRNGESFFLFSLNTLMLGFLEWEAPRSQSSNSSQLSPDLNTVWPQRLRALLWPSVPFGFCGEKSVIIICNHLLNAFYAQAILFDTKSTYSQGAFHIVKKIHIYTLESINKKQVAHAKNMKGVQREERSLDLGCGETRILRIRIDSSRSIISVSECNSKIPWKSLG